MQSTERGAGPDGSSPSGTQLAAAARLTGIGYFSVDVARGLIDADARCSEILGIPLDGLRFDDVLRLLLVRLHGDDTIAVHHALKRAIASGEPFEVHGRVVSNDSEEREQWLAASGASSASADGTSILAGALIDHTEQRLREERWLRGQKREALGALAAGIAHDLNNVMAAVVGNATLARYEIEGGHSATESVREVEQAAGRAGEMLRRLLRFGRDDMDQSVRFELSEVVHEACKLLGPIIQDGIRLNWPDPATPSSMVGDPAQIHQLVINLVTNAVYVLPGGGQIDIVIEPPSADPARAEDETLRLHVRDTGPGIDEALLLKIFDPFFTTKTPEEGTGLGLSAATVIADLHRGAITVDSELGRGTTFTVAFPTDDPGDVDDAGRMVGRFKALRVALVAAEPKIRLDALAAMPSFGLVPIPFADGPAALAALALDPTGFDALVCDGSAAVSTSELVKAARAVRPDLPIVINASIDGALTRTQALGLGADAWVPRPCPPSELCAAVHRLV